MSRCLNCDEAVPSVEDFCSGSCQREYSDRRQQKAENWAVCQSYIRRTNTLPEAKTLAAKEGVIFNTSVWITAFGKLLNSPFNATAVIGAETTIRKVGS